jgi:polyisoprenoid-binding protein YceI
MSTIIANEAGARTRSIWEIDSDHTEIGFEVKHLMISKVRGRFGSASGRIALDEDDRTRSMVEVSVAAASIDTDQRQRDEHLRSVDFLDAAQYPVLSFRSTRIEEVEEGGDGFRLIGELTIRNVTREVALEVREEGRATDPWGGERAAFSATTSIDRRDFGMTWNEALEAGGILVGNEVRISLEVQAVKVS